MNIFQWFLETFMERCRFSTYYFQKDLTEVFDFNKTELANSANSKCRPFQVKINCPKFIIDALQPRCHMTFYVSLFITLRNLVLGVFKENYYNLTKNSHKFLTSVTDSCAFLSSKRSGISTKYFKSTWEKK